MNNRFQVVSPADNSVYLEREIAGLKDMEQALVRAEKARRAWRTISVADRAAICQKAVDYFQHHAGQIGEELSWQMGRPVRYTPFELTKGLKERAEYMIGIADEALMPPQIAAQSGFRRFIQREPLGTVLVLAPWNYPYLTSVNAIIPALMAGNTVILKHAMQTPLCAERYAAAFESAGLPPGVFQYLHLTHDQVAAIIRDQRIDFVAFTGSVEGGLAINQALSKRFINAGLELGGKDPAYVRADARLEFAVENLVDGAFFNSGQSCCGIERIYVAQPLFDDFVDRFVALTGTYRLGHPLDPEVTLGPMIRTTAATQLQQQIQAAVDRGAQKHIDASRFTGHRDGTPYLAPQVLTGVDHSMQLMTKESFGPVVGIMPVKSDQEAIELMNDSAYGLTASVWTQDEDRALEIGQEVKTGTFFMNRCDYLDPALAWTGIKNSGRGCSLSAIGYEVLTRPKSFHLRL